MRACQNGLANSLATYYVNAIDMNAVKVSPKFQVVIPKDVRSRLQIKAGDQLSVATLDGRIELVPLQKPKALRGFVRGIDTSIKRERSERV